MTKFKVGYNVFVVLRRGEFVPHFFATIQSISEIGINVKNTLNNQLLFVQDCEIFTKEEYKAWLVLES